jgi:hypothetical protein
MPRASVGLLPNSLLSLHRRVSELCDWDAYLSPRGIQEHYELSPRDLGNCHPRDFGPNRFAELDESSFQFYAASERGSPLSYFDLRRRVTSASSREGMKPPALTPMAVLADLRWQFTLYRTDKLPVRTTLAFLALRVLHLIQYHRGWKSGARDA